MGRETGIAWTDHTFNPWWGCTKVSPGCDNCYAETFDKRVGGKHWGAGAERRVFADKHWAEPLKWNAAALKARRRARVFCASMADVFDAEAPSGQLERLWALIRATPALDWQLLTKRPHRIAGSLPLDWGAGYPNVWLGTTVESQEQAAIRIPRLLSVPALVRFLSCEPLLGPVDLDPLSCQHCESTEPTLGEPGSQPWCNECDAEMGSPGWLDPDGIHWVIVGGESGSKARRFVLGWADSLIAQCKREEVACFVKQLGSRPAPNDIGRQSRNGDDWTLWPEFLRVRQFPRPSEPHGGSR